MVDSGRSIARPRPAFSVISAVAVIVGVVLGIGIFRMPPLVAEQAGGPAAFMGFWLLGGVISLLGALCYAELASAEPDSGGEYTFLRRAFGRPLGFLFVWGRLTVMQTGSIALVAFILGEHASLLLALGPHSTPIYAALTVVLLTALNLWGTGPARDVQNTVVALVVLALLLLAAYALLTGASGSETAPLTGEQAPTLGTPGLAMIFVLLTYGGWNEAAYLSAEQRRGRSGVPLALMLAVVLITVLYLAINWVYLQVFGFEGLRQGNTVGVALAEALFGEGAMTLMASLVVVAALSTANATIITGARANYALGRDFAGLGRLGVWRARGNTPANALLLQGAIALLLVLLGSYSHQAVATLVEFTAPAFWAFMLLTTLSLLVLRHRQGAPDRGAVPCYPLTPLVFALVCGYMVYSSLVFTGIGAVWGVALLLAGLPVYWLVNTRRA